MVVISVVLQGRNKKTGEEVALKRIIIDRDNGINLPDVCICVCVAIASVFVYGLFS